MSVENQQPRRMAITTIPAGLPPAETAALSRLLVSRSRTILAELTRCLERRPYRDSEAGLGESSQGPGAA